MMNFLNDWGLVLTIFLPLAGALVMMAIPKQSEGAIKLVALGAPLAAAAMGILLMLNFDYGDSESLQFMVNRNWIELINSNFILGLDGLSLPLLALTLFIVPLVVIYSWQHVPNPGNPKAFFTLMLILETAMIGSFLAQDLILFFVFFEVTLLPMYFLIGVWGGEQRRYASIKFFLYTLFGSAFMIVAFVALYFLAKAPTGIALEQLRALGGSYADMQAGDPLRSFGMQALTYSGAAGIAKTTAIVIFGGMFLGFGIKVPMFPFHTWLPGPHAGISHPCSSLAQVGYLRIHPNCNSNPPSCCSSLGTDHWHLGRDWHHLRCAWLSGPDRYEAAHCILLGVSYGLHHVGNLYPDCLWLERRCVRHGGSRPDHWAVVLHRRLRQGALPHARYQATRRPTRLCAQDGLDSRFRHHGFTWAPWFGRFLGRVPSNPFCL